MAKIKVKVSTNADKRRIKYDKNLDTIKIWVRSPPERGKANAEIIGFFEDLGLEANILSGLKSNNKLINIRDHNTKQIIDIIKTYGQ